MYIYLAQHNVPLKSKLTHPPRATRRAFQFLENFCSNSPLPRPKAVQKPHHRSIPGDQMPSPPGNFSVSLEPVYVNMV